MPNNGGDFGLKMSQFSCNSDFPFRYDGLGAISIIYVKC